jgi:DNA-binding LytR/AlgR family response regulator
MKEVRCIIVEDELPAVGLLEGYLADVPGWKLAGSFSNALDALAFLSTESVDVIFLDIELPKLSGLDFIKTLRHPPLVVITSAYSEHAVEAFELVVFDYLLKPYSFDRFVKTINRLNERLNQSDELTENPEPAYLLVKENKENVRVPVDNILYVESQREYVKIVLEDRAVLTRMSMNNITEQLVSHGFLRIHRSYLLPVARITSFNKSVVRIGDTAFSVGRFYKADVHRRLRDSVREEE